MAKVQYREIRFQGKTLETIRQANQIIREYERAGYTLTLRQLYYRFVAAGLIPNKQSEYDKLGETITAARYGGMVDWDALEDRTRNLGKNPHWRDPGDIIACSARDYGIDLWDIQDHRVEVWVEKQALEGIISRVALAEDCPYIACRGYMSASEMRVAALRMIGYEEDGKIPVILHLGDHDPSGVDMSRDIQDRLREFCQAHGKEGPEVERIALTMKQVREYDPPPNPAKITDSRAVEYIRQYGNESWELDALPPEDLATLIRDNVRKYRNEGLYQLAREKQEKERQDLTACSKGWENVCGFLRGSGPVQDSPRIRLEKLVKEFATEYCWGLGALLDVVEASYPEPEEDTQEDEYTDEEEGEEL